MKDSLILEGKIYISARRAANNKLCSGLHWSALRQVKLECKWSEDLWFVTEESLFAHRSNALESTQEKSLKIIKN